MNPKVYSSKMQYCFTTASISPRKARTSVSCLCLFCEEVFIRERAESRSQCLVCSGFFSILLSLRPVSSWARQPWSSSLPLPSQWVPRVCLSPPTHCWGCSHSFSFYMGTGGSNPALTLVQKALNWPSHFSAPLLFFSLKLFRIQRFWELGRTREKPRHDGLIRWGHYWFLDTALFYFPTFWFQNTATHPLLCLSDQSLSSDTLCRAHINAQ